jgi:hypothetical protein
MLLFCLLTTLLVVLLLTVLNYGRLMDYFSEKFRNIYWQLFFVSQFFIMQLNGIIIAYLNAFKVFTPQAKFASRPHF